MPGTELFGDEERKEVMDVLETGVLFRYNHDNERKGHWKARSLEEELKKMTGAQNAHTCSSGTAAVSIALAACGIGHGDHVIVPPFTFMATIEAVVMAGAIPVFAEIDETLCLSVEGIKAVMSDKIKAIVLVHMCGGMANIEEIAALAKEKNIKLIEDSAQALGCTYHGKHVGLFGDAGTFSFDFFKLITAGEGGAVITNNQQTYENAEQFSDHGHNHKGNNRGAEDHPILGSNFRLGELNAAVALAQIRKAPYMLEKQRAHKTHFVKNLKEVEGITFRNIPDESGDCATFFNFFMPTEESARKLAKLATEKGLGGVAYWYDNNYHYYRNWGHFRNRTSPMPLAMDHLECPQDYANIKFPKSDDVVGRLISIVVKVKWSPEEVEHFSKTLKACAEEAINVTAHA